jgi:hypothetical protein
MSSDHPTYRDRIRAAVYRDRRLGGLALALACLTAITSADGVRTALLAALAAGAVVVTRIRFSAHGAIALLVAAALLVVSGPALGD